MIAIGTVLAALIVSLIITRVATVTLALTGLSRESARFQARSAFTGVGFTTSEAESVVSHPVRRRVVLLLMLLGNAGLVTIVASLLISFAKADGSEEAWQRVALLFGGLLAVFLLARSVVVDRFLSRLIARLLDRFTDLDVRDYAALLQLKAGYGIAELKVPAGHWAADRSLEDLDLRAEGIAVLGIEHAGGGYEGVPRGESGVSVGDTLVLYGQARALAEFGRRRAGPEGDRAHDSAARGRRGPAGRSARS